MSTLPIFRLEARRPALHVVHARWAPILLAASSALAATFANAKTAETSAAPAEHFVDEEPESNGQLSRTTIDDTDPSAAVPTPEEAMKDPIQFGYLLMDLTDRADAAAKNKDFATSARYYKAIVKAAPQRSIGYAKLCEAYAGMNDLATARDICYEALFHDGPRPHDYLQFMHLLLDTKKIFGPDDLAQADGVFTHLKEQKVELPEIYQIKCDVALRVNDLQRLESCTKELASGWPNDPKTITYQWSLAVKKKDFAAADSLVQRARTSSMAPEGIQKMESATVALKQNARPKLLALGAGATALLLLGALTLRYFRQARPTST